MRAHGWALDCPAGVFFGAFFGAKLAGGDLRDDDEAVLRYLPAGCRGRIFCSAKLKPRVR